jgi:crossover junction endodeoxyribonuclease RuvC
VQLLAVEWPYVGENPQSALDLAACCGAALASAGEVGIPAHLISPAQAKQALAGVGNAPKEQMIAAVRLQFGRTVPKDQADAVGIALAALTLARRPAQLRLPTKRAKAKKG